MATSQVFKKRLTVDYFSSPDAYESFKHVTAVSSALYPDDFRQLNDNVQSRHKRNAKELTYLISLLKEGKMDLSHLKVNSWNAFFASHVLLSHFEGFVRSLQGFRQREIQGVLHASTKLQKIGAYLDAKLSWNLKKVDRNAYPTLSQTNAIIMPDPIYFYSKVTSLHIDYAVFIAERQEKQYLCLVEVRKADKSFANGVKAMDFGATVSMDYLLVGYNFNNAVPLHIQQIGKEHSSLLSSLSLSPLFTQFELTLLDLHKALSITISYTSMRKQFKTLPDSKEERAILTYQAVGERIVEGFATYIGLCDLKGKLIGGGIKEETAAIVQHAHKSVLPILIKLRQCCGGYGYLRVSGHPGCIERVSFRAAFIEDIPLPLTQQILTKTHYNSSNLTLSSYYTNLLNPKLPTNYLDVFAVFNLISLAMRQSYINPAQINSNSSSSYSYPIEFLRQASLQSMHSAEFYSRHDVSNLHGKLLKFAMAGYVLEHGQWVDWSKLPYGKEDYYGLLKDQREELLIEIQSDLTTLGETLQVSHFRNVILGRSNSSQFYEKVVKVSKDNLRNDKDFVQYVKAPLTQMLTQNRARL